MIKKSLSEFLYRKYNCAFSQGGEDVILAGLFANKLKGFFVDIGAYHPYRLSNTFLFYRKGWRGINIDAAYGSMELFKKYRPEDINLEIAVSDDPQELTYYFMGTNNSMNTFSKEFIDKLGSADKVQKEIKMMPQRLDTVLEKYADGREINFMSVDVEGYEIPVMRSNDWNKFRPHVILLESFEAMNDKNDYDIELKEYLYDKGYRVICKTANAIFFMRNDLELNKFNNIIL